MNSLLWYSFGIFDDQRSPAKNEFFLGRFMDCRFFAQFSERQPDRPPIALDRQQLFDSLVKKICDQYVFPGIADRVVKELQRVAAGNIGK